VTTVQSAYSQSQTVLPSIVAFLDILGFSRSTQEASLAGTENDLLARLLNALSTASSNIRDRSVSGPVAYHDIKFFTDNVAIGIPTHDLAFEGGEPELGFALRSIGSYVLDMSLSGFFVRGGLSFGNHYMDDTVVFGPALLEAHDLEDQAVYPCVVLGDSILNLVKRHLLWYSSVDVAPHNRHIAVSGDQRFFVNYLHMLDDGFGPDPSGLAAHREIITTQLSALSGDRHVLEKYIWLANYHNWYCRVEGTPTAFLIDAPKRFWFNNLSDMFERVGNTLSEVPLPCRTRLRMKSDTQPSVIRRKHQAAGERE